MATTPSIPYVKQSETKGNGERNCGAACLSMAYASFGMKVSIDEIWPAIAKRNAFGSLASTTHLMAKDAIGRGFDAIIFQATHPMQVLRICQEEGIRAILNHRLDNSAPAGHYSLLAGLDKSGVLIHDPLVGPNRWLSFEQLTDLWRPVSRRSETIGNVVIGIAQRPETEYPEVCATCRLPIPEHAPCPKCQHPVRLRPATALGCIAETCSNRHWSYLSCPECDCTWSFYGKPDVAKAEPAPAKSALDIDQMYSHVDKMIEYIQRNPAAIEHEDLQKQIAFIASQKEVLRMAIADSAAFRKQRMEQVDKLNQIAETNRESLKKRREEATIQSSPLDGDALGMALLRNLGFVR